VALLFAGETRTLEDAVAFARTLGAALGCEAAAADLAARTLARRDALCARPGPRVGKRAVSYSNMGAGGWAAGGVTTAAETLRLARLENAAAAKRGHARLTHEELIALDPDLIVVSAAWEGEGGFDCREWLLAEPALADLAAVRGARVLAMPPRLFAATSQEIASAAEWLAEEADRLFADAEPLPGAAHE
jgi:ABC-type Fe3+-hydroxamate transport system substrate-binding protein